MSPDEMAAVMATRIPTPAEFVAFVRGQGWAVVIGDSGKAGLRASKDDDLAVKLAKMLSREPWRTQVLELVAETTVAPEPEPVAAPEASQDEADEWEQCPLCLADVHPQDAARLCNPLTRPRAVLNVAPDGTMTTVRTPRCHYEMKPPNGEC